MMMMSAGLAGRGKHPFTTSQWQELEHQALVYKYLISGMPIPPDLLFTIRRSLDSSISSKFLLPQPQHQTIGWSGNFHMGLGRKIDPEPGRCRRTDGKKWRCSKEVYPDSKYCERHMHRGRNRSRKPVEVLSQPRASDSLLLNSSISTPTHDFRRNRGTCEEQHSLLCESGSSSSNSGTMRRAENDFSWKLALSQTIQNSSYGMTIHDHIPQKNDQQQHHPYSFDMPFVGRDEQQPKKVMHHFLDDWGSKDSHEDEAAHLSNPMHDFFMNPKW